MLKLHRLQAYANFGTVYFVLFSTFTLSGLEFYLGEKTTEYFGFVAAETKFFGPATVSTKYISVECRQACQNQIFINLNTINSFILV